MHQIATRWLRSAGIVMATGLLLLLCAVVEPSSLSRAALSVIWPFAGILIIAALGQTLVIQQRGIDLSIPGFISLAGIVVSHGPNGDSSKLFGFILLAYLFGFIGGVVNGFMVTRVGMPPIVQTLGMNAALYGVDIAICHGTPTETTAALQNFASSSVLGLPTPFVIALVLVVAIEIVIKKTAFGRRFEAGGVSDRAGRSAGIRVDGYQFTAYVGSAMLYTTAGILLGGMILQPDPFAGDVYLLASVAAVVLGGTSLLGGSGSAVASAMGAFFLIVLQQFILATGAERGIAGRRRGTGLGSWPRYLRPAAAGRGSECDQEEVWRQIFSYSGACKQCGCPIGEGG